MEIESWFGGRILCVNTKTKKADGKEKKKLHFLGKQVEIRFKGCGKFEP